MTGKPMKSKNDLTASLQQAITGLDRYLKQASMLLHGQTVSSDDAIATLQAQIDALNASAAAYQAWLQAVAKQRAAYAATALPMLAAIRTYVAAAFGPQSDEYLAFGFKPPKKAVKSPEAKVVGAVKLRATRKARHTMGSKQRLAIKGEVPAAITLTTSSVSSSEE
jgi:hypothetical protein